MANRTKGGHFGVFGARAPGLMGWWDWSGKFRQGGKVKISIQTDEVNISCDITTFSIDKD